MKRHKVPSLSGLVAETIQATRDIGTQWILDLCNGIVKEGCIPKDWKLSVELPIYKGNGDPMECGSYREIKSLDHAIKKSDEDLLIWNSAAWQNTIKEDVKKMVLEWEDAKYFAGDGTKCKTLIIQSSRGNRKN